MPPAETNGYALSSSRSSLIGSYVYASVIHNPAHCESPKCFSLSLAARNLFQTARHSLLHMPPGILRLRLACGTLVVPVRLAICLPLLICTFDAYSPHAALLPQGTLPITTNSTRTDSASSNLPEDAHQVSAYLALCPTATPHIGRALTLAYVISAAAFSMLSIVAAWWFSDFEGDNDDATLVEGGRAHRLRVASLFLGIVIRLLLGGLGTTAMVKVIGERSIIKNGSYIAVEVLGWLLVAVLYCGAFHRILSLFRDPVLQGERMDGLDGQVVKCDRTLDTISKPRELR
ncbi:hypothetical protein BC834DRAFT_912648 [Gloeopeniophorella convolvens]|nr:hypothetical protein BC834DRAFT_912648 [Gloeopeniophorella convolvens]